MIYQDISGGVMAPVRVKFSSQADPQLLAKIRSLAMNQGRPRAHVLEAFGMSMEEFDQLYQKLAK